MSRTLFRVRCCSCPCARFPGFIQYAELPNKRRGRSTSVSSFRMPSFRRVFSVIMAQLQVLSGNWTRGALIAAVFSMPGLRWIVNSGSRTLKYNIVYRCCGNVRKNMNVRSRASSLTINRPMVVSDEPPVLKGLPAIYIRIPQF